MNDAPTPDSPSTAPRVLVIGVGQAGANLVAALGTSAESLYPIRIADSDGLALRQHAQGQSIALGPRCMRGLSAGGDPARGNAAAEEVSTALRESFSGHQFVIFMGGLGGGTATGALPVMARIARDAGALVLSVVTQPFEFEGEQRTSIADAGLEELRRAADAVVALPNEKLALQAGNAPSLIEAFAEANREIAEGVRGLLRLLVRRGLIPVDFTTLSGALRGRNARSVLASVSASGPDRIHTLIKALQSSSLLADNEVLKKADSVIVSLAGGSDLKLPEVSRLTKEIRACCGRGGVTVGATVEESLTGRVLLTVLATERASEIEGAPNRISELSEPEAPASAGPGFDSEFVRKSEPPRRRTSRVVPPAPDLTPQAREQLISRHAPVAQRGRRRGGPRMRQQQLALDVVSVSRFDKSQPTIRDGHDLDIPTFIRRGIVLN